MVRIGVLQFASWQTVHFWSPSRDRSTCANAGREPKSTETLAQVRRSRITFRLFFLRLGNLGCCCLHFDLGTRTIRAMLNFASASSSDINHICIPSKTNRKQVQTPIT